MKSFRPVYLKSFKEGEIRATQTALQTALNECKLCPRKCGINRLDNNVGICKTGEFAKVSSVSPHFGEEAPLVGQGGSGTIFFTNCNLLCNFCQNFDISHQENGEEVTNAQLANMMLYLQSLGCHNINFVTPSHVVPQIISALELAIEAGLSIPLAYNSSAYDDIETIKMLDGIIDIYMPDLKFLNNHISTKTCDAPDYPTIAKEVIIEMHRQVGELKLDDNGIAQRGLLIRHLVMPGCLEDTKEVIRFIVKKISPTTFVNIMPQYCPAGNISKTPEFNRLLDPEEYKEALIIANEEGLVNLL